MPKKAENDYEVLGKKLVELYETGEFRNRLALGKTFTKGAVYGFGAAMGGTVGVTLLIWILSRFHSLPLIGHIVDTIQNSLNK